MLIFLFLICRTLGMQTIGSKDTNLDPGRITWWKESWSRGPILLSSNHVGSSLTLTVHFRPSTSIASGVIEVFFPTGVSHASLVNSVYSTTTSLTAGTDQTLVISAVTVSLTGQFGPFGLKTRRSTGGQIVDSNGSFGSLYVYPAVTDNSGLTVSSASNQSVATIGSTDDLFFSFSITEDLWAHDIIIITPSSYYTPSSTVTCTSITVDENPNYLVGSSSNDLPCEVNGSSILIYGIASDIIVDTTIKLKIQVGSFTLPSVTYATGYTWQLSLYRFATDTLIAQYVSSVRPILLNPGSITVSEWSTVRTYEALDLVPNIELFMTTKFRATHEIPANGKINFEFEGVDILAPIWYYTDSDKATSVTQQCVFTPYTTGSLCTVNSATTLSVTTSTVIAATTEVTVTTLTKLVNSPSVRQVTTFDSGNLMIDQSSLNPQTKDLEAGANYVLMNFEVESDNTGTITSGTGRWSSGDEDGRYLFFTASPTTYNWADYVSGDGTTLNIYCPLSTVDLSFSEFYFASSTTWVDKTDGTLASAQDHSASTNSKSNTVVNDTEDKITAYPTAVTAGDSYALSASGNGGAGVNYVKMPLISSNLNTFYECYARAFTVSNSGSATESTVYHVGAARFSVVAAAPTNFQLNPICTEGIAGIPLLLEFEGVMTSMDLSTQSYSIEITIDVDLGLGTSVIPVYSSEDSDITGTYSFVSSDSTVSVTAFSATLSVGNYIRVYIPTGSSITGTRTWTCTFQYPDTVHGEVNVIFRSTGSFTAASAAPGMTLTVSGSTTYYPSTVSTLTMDSVSGGGSNRNYIGIIAPTGTDLSSAGLSISSSNPAKTIVLTSADPSFSGNVILGLESASFNIDTSSVVLSLTGVTSPQTEGTFTMRGFEAQVSSNVPTKTTCVSANNAGAAFTISQNTLNGLTISISSCKRRGPTNVDTTMTISLPLQHIVPATGKITAVLSSSWTSTEFTACVCSTGDTCVFSSTTAEVTVASDVAADTVVIITITGLLPPDSGTAGTSINFLTSLGTSLSSNNIEFSSAITLSCSLQDPDTIGTVSLQATLMPNAAGLSEVGLYLLLGSTIDVPANSIIQISPGFTTWLYTGADESIQDLCWSSVEYKECKINSGNVELQLASDYSGTSSIEIYLDKALNIPSTVGETSSGISVSIKWSSTAVEIAKTSTDLLMTINAAPTGSISGSSLTSSVDNAGEAATYTFTFTSDQVIDSSSYFWLVFPSVYDPYIGDADNIHAECEPNIFYIRCESSKFPDIKCAADHWTILVNGLATVPSSEEVTIVIKDVRNPRETSGTGNFQLIQFASTGTVVAANQAFGTLGINSPPDLISYKKTINSSQSLINIAEHSFDFYVDSSLSNLHSIYVIFPSQYDLELSVGSTQVECSSVYFDESASNPDKDTEMSWSTVTSCTVENNSVMFTIKENEAKTFASTDKVRITIKNIPNPQIALTRSNEALIYDTQPSKGFPSYDYWTEKFEVLLYNSGSSTIEKRTYPPLNSGYIGLSADYKRPITINNYNPAVKSNRIKVHLGTQTADIPITLNWPLVSEQLVLSPSANPYTSDHGGFLMQSPQYSYTFYQWKNEISFRLAVQSTLSTGLYYLEWSLDETRESGTITDKYLVPPRTLVEICAASRFSIEVESVPFLRVGYTSVPIKVTPASPPVSDFALTMAISNSTTTQGVVLNNSTLEFKPNTDALYFSITLESTYDITSTNPILTFSLSGTNAGSYNAPGDRVLSIDSSTNTDAGRATLQAQNLNAHSAEVKLTPSQSGVFHWYLGCQGHPGYTFTDLKAMAPDLLSNSTALEDQLAEEYSSTEVNLASTDTSIFDFLRRQYSKHCGTTWINSLVLYENTASTLTLDWLYASTTYVFGGYLDNLLGSTPEEATVTFTTTSLPTVHTLQIELRSDISSSQSEIVRDIIADRLGVNPLWLASPQFWQTSSRRLAQVQSTFFSWYVLFDRGLTDVSPSNIVQQSSVLELTKEDLVDRGFVSDTSFVFFTSSAISSDTPAQWVTTPVFNSSDSTSGLFSVRTTIDGLACASCARTIDSSTSSSQVLAALTANSSSADGAACADTIANTDQELVISGLESSTTYYCYLAVCSDYPLWPTCREADSHNGLTMIEFTTKAPEEELEVAATLFVGILISLII